MASVRAETVRKLWLFLFDAGLRWAYHPVTYYTYEVITITQLSCV